MCVHSFILPDIKLIHNGRQNSLVPRPSPLPRRAEDFLMCDDDVNEAQSSLSDTIPCGLIAHNNTYIFQAFPPLYLHTGSNQIPESAKAWKQGSLMPSYPHR